MNNTEEIVRRGLAATALLIPDEERLVVTASAERTSRRAMAWTATRAAVLVLALGVVTMLITSGVGAPEIPQGPCEVLWDQLARSSDPESLAVRANLPTDVYVPADLDGSTMHCTAVTEGTIDGPGTITGLAITDSDQTEVWLVLGVGGEISDWVQRLEELGFENLRPTHYGLTNGQPRTPEVNFWVKAAEYAAGRG